MHAYPDYGFESVSRSESRLEDAGFGSTLAAFAIAALVHVASPVTAHVVDIACRIDSVKSLVAAARSAAFALGLTA